MNITNFSKILSRIKIDYESCITSRSFNGKTYANGGKAKEALIRSQKLICYIHEFVKKELINNGINPSKIYPPLNQNYPEIQLVGHLKQKKQDLCIIPNIKSAKPTIITSGPLVGSEDKLGIPLLKRTISINIRSQLSSLQKNFDTLYERTFAEALNLHLRAPQICLGEIYLIPTHEYDDTAMKENKIKFKAASNLSQYIRSFQAINSRWHAARDHYKYERIFLAIADFRKSPPKLYSNAETLIKDGLLESDKNTNLNNLSINNFVEDLLREYEVRFSCSKLK